MLGDDVEGDVLGGDFLGGPLAPSVGALASCFPDTLDGLAVTPIPLGLGGDLFARAYLERRPGGRSININVWDAAQSDLTGQLTQFPLLGEDDAARSGSGIERRGGHHEGHPSESDWEELSSGEHRDTFTVQVSESRLVSVRVQPASTAGEAARIFRSLDLVCLVGATSR